MSQWDLEIYQKIVLSISRKIVKWHCAENSWKFVYILVGSPCNIILIVNTLIENYHFVRLDFLNNETFLENFQHYVDVEFYFKKLLNMKCLNVSNFISIWIRIRKGVGNFYIGFSKFSPFWVSHKKLILTVDTFSFDEYFDANKRLILTPFKLTNIFNFNKMLILTPFDCRIFWTIQFSTFTNFPPCT